MKTKHINALPNERIETLFKVGANIPVIPCVELNRRSINTGSSTVLLIEHLLEDQSHSSTH